MVVVVLVLLLTEASAWLALGCFCCSAVVLGALVLLLAEASAWLAIGCCCCSAVVLVALVLLLAETSAWLANGGCCCCGAVVLVALVLLLAETSAWLTMAAAAVVQWCVSRWCYSSRGHRLGWRWVLLCSAAVVLVALVPLLAETSAWWATGAAAVVQWCSSCWC